MVKVREDLTGMVFGKLIVLSQVDDYIYPNNNKREARWLCECNCNKHNHIIVRQSLLKDGKTRSCGCLHIETAVKNGKNNAKYNKYKLNLVDEHGYYGIGITSNTDKEFYFDMEDYELIKNYCWHEYVDDKGYSSLRAKSKNTKTILKLSELIGCKYYDHEDRNTLNNRKYNLRPANFSENGMNKNRPKNNTSEIIGVSFDKDSNKWKAYINIDKKQTSLGKFINKNDAIKARLEAECIYYGEFAPQKHLYEQYGITTQN